MGNVGESLTQLGGGEIIGVEYGNECDEVKRSLMGPARKVKD